MHIFIAKSALNIEYTKLKSLLTLSLPLQKDALNNEIMNNYSASYTPELCHFKLQKYAVSPKCRATVA